MIARLFQGYAVVKDKEFVRYMRTKQDAYDEGASMDADDLMQYALNKYNLRMQETDSFSPNKERQELYALRAEMEKMKAGTKGQKHTTKSEKWAWKDVPWKEGDAKTKTFSNKTYHWCPQHASWTIHKPEDCKGKSFFKGKKSEYQANSSQHEETAPTTPAEQKKLTLINAMRAMVNDDDSSESE